MAKGKKRKASIDENVDSYRHESETCKNVFPVGLASYDTSKPKPKKYEYDSHCDNIKQQFLTAIGVGIARGDGNKSISFFVLFC